MNIILGHIYNAIKNIFINFNQSSTICYTINKLYLLIRTQTAVSKAEHAVRRATWIEPFTYRTVAAMQNHISFNIVLYRGLTIPDGTRIVIAIFLLNKQCAFIYLKFLVHKKLQ